MKYLKGGQKSRTPVRTPDHCPICRSTRLRSNAKVRQLDRSVLIRQNIGSFNVPVDNTFVV